MYKYIIRINGMKCGMCESHINDVMRRNFNVKKVKSSHLKATTIMFSIDDICIDDIKSVVKETGYVITEIEKCEAIKKGWRYK